MKALQGILAALTVAGLGFLTGGCEKMSDNGPIDGLWMMEKHYTRAASAEGLPYSEVVDVEGKGIVWAFQLNLLSMRSNGVHNGLTDESVARFSLEGNVLQVGPTYIHFRDRDSLLTDPHTTCLEEVGIRGNAARFRVHTLNSKRMVLCSERDSLVLRKC